MLSLRDVFLADVCLRIPVLLKLVTQIFVVIVVAGSCLRGDEIILLHCDLLRLERAIIELGRRVRVRLTRKVRVYVLVIDLIRVALAEALVVVVGSSNGAGLDDGGVEAFDVLVVDEKLAGVLVELDLVVRFELLEVVPVLDWLVERADLEVPVVADLAAGGRLEVDVELAEVLDMVALELRDVVLEEDVILVAECRAGCYLVDEMLELFREERALLPEVLEGLLPEDEEEVVEAADEVEIFVHDEEEDLALKRPDGVLRDDILGELLRLLHVLEEVGDELRRLELLERGAVAV